MIEKTHLHIATQRFLEILANHPNSAPSAVSIMAIEQADCFTEKYVEKNGASKEGELQDLFDAYGNACYHRSDDKYEIRDKFIAALSNHASEKFDQDKFMTLVREFAEVCYGLRHTTEDVGGKLIKYVKSLTDHPA